MSEIDKRISVLEKELADLRRHKLAALQSEVAALQASLSSDDGATARRGRPPGAPSAPRRGRPPKAESRGWATTISTDPAAFSSTAPRKKRGRKRGKHIPDEEALSMLSQAVGAAGPDGISARQASQLSGVFYPRAITLMDKNFKKSGSGKWTRYTI